LEVFKTCSKNYFFFFCSQGFEVHIGSLADGWCSMLLEEVTQEICCSTSLEACSRPVFQRNNKKTRRIMRNSDTYKYFQSLFIYQLFFQIRFFNFYVAIVSVSLIHLKLSSSTTYFLMFLKLVVNYLIYSCKFCISSCALWIYRFMMAK